MQLLWTLCGFGKHLFTMHFLFLENNWSTEHQTICQVVVHFCEKYRGHCTSLPRLRFLFKAALEFSRGLKAQLGVTDRQSRGRGKGNLHPWLVLPHRYCAEKPKQCLEVAVT